MTRAYYGNLWRRFFQRKPVTVRSFKKLKVGRFIAQTDIYIPRSITNWTKLLGESNSMEDEQRERIKQRQLKKYYTKPFYHIPIS